MIKIGKDYQITTDKYQFILNTRADGKDKDGNSKDSWSQTYHASIKQCCAAIVDKQAKEAIERDLLSEFVPSIDRLCLAVSMVKEAEKES